MCEAICTVVTSEEEEFAETQSPKETAANKGKYYIAVNQLPWVLLHRQKLK